MLYNVVAPSRYIEEISFRRLERGAVIKVCKHINISFDRFDRVVFPNFYDPTISI